MRHRPWCGRESGGVNRVLIESASRPQEESQSPYERRASWHAAPMAISRQRPVVNIWGELGGVEDVTTQEQIDALWSLAKELRDQHGRERDELGVLDALLSDQVREREGRWTVVLARLRRAELWESAGRSDEAIDEYERLRHEFPAVPGDPEPSVELLSRARRCTCLRRAGRDEEAIAECDQLIAKYAGTAEPAVRDRVGRAMLTKAKALNHAKRHEAAISATDALIAARRDEQDQLSRELLIWALHERVFALMRLQRGRDTILAAQQFLTQWEREADAVRKRTARDVENVCWLVNGSDVLNPACAEQALRIAERLIAGSELDDDAVGRARARVLRGSMLSVPLSTDTDTEIDNIIQGGLPAATALSEIAAEREHDCSSINQSGIATLLYLRALVLHELHDDEQTLLQLEDVIERFADLDIAKDIVDSARELRAELDT